MCVHIHELSIFEEYCFTGVFALIIGRLCQYWDKCCSSSASGSVCLPCSIRKQAKHFDIRPCYPRVGWWQSKLVILLKSSMFQWGALIVPLLQHDTTYHMFMDAYCCEKISFLRTSTQIYLVYLMSIKGISMLNGCKRYCRPKQQPV